MAVADLRHAEAWLWRSSRPVHDADARCSLQRNSFGYFLHESTAANGLVLDKTGADWPASIAAVGMALTAYPVGVQRGFISARRGAAAHADDAALPRRQRAERRRPTRPATAASTITSSTWRRGRRAWHMRAVEHRHRAADRRRAGRRRVLRRPVGARDRDPRARHAALRARRLGLDARRRPARSATAGGPSTGFLPYRWEGYDEALILYLLALGSPTHPIAPACRTTPGAAPTSGRTVYGIDYLHAGPLFIHQMSHIWCDFRGIRDAFMREHDSDYFENSRRATWCSSATRSATRSASRTSASSCWGITASDGPGAQIEEASTASSASSSTTSRAACRTAPTTARSRRGRSPRRCRSRPRSSRRRSPTSARCTSHVANPYGFKASFNPAFPSDADDGVGWVSPYHFGINEGPTVLMIENHRSGLVWTLMRTLRAAASPACARAGFDGGWLDAG